MKCQKKSSFCDGQDVKLVQLKSSTNVYQGEIIRACKGCRIGMHGGYKFVK